MDLWQLHIFSKVVERASFSKAAETVHLSQPTVSSHIKDLEEHFGCRLVDRLGKEVVPTKAGELLYKYAIRLLTLRDETQSAISAFLGKPKGKLVIGGSTIPGGYILPDVIGQFVRTYPAVSVSLLIGDSQVITNHVLEGKVELGVVGAIPKEKRITHEKIAHDEILLVVPRGHRFFGRKQVSLDDLAKEPFIMREKGSGTRRTLENILARHDLRPDHFHIMAEMGSTESVREAILAGVGISLLSTRAIVRETKSGQLWTLQIADMDFGRHFYSITHRQRTLSPLSAAFGDFVKKHAG